MEVRRIQAEPYEFDDQTVTRFNLVCKRARDEAVRRRFLRDPDRGWARDPRRRLDGTPPSNKLHLSRVNRVT